MIFDNELSTWKRKKVLTFYLIIVLIIIVIIMYESTIKSQRGMRVLAMKQYVQEEGWRGCGLQWQNIYNCSIMESTTYTIQNPSHRFGCPE